MKPSTESAPAAVPGKPKNKLLRTIAVFKFVETLVVVLAGVAALKLLNPATLAELTSWSQALNAAREQAFATAVLKHLSGLPPSEVEELGVGAFFLAAIFLLEGVGLWLEARWAEWLSVVATSVFIPLEGLELVHKASSSKAIALVLNLAVVGYLIARIIRERGHTAQ